VGKHYQYTKYSGGLTTVAKGAIVVLGTALLLFLSGVIPAHATDKASPPVKKELRRDMQQKAAKEQALAQAQGCKNYATFGGAVVTLRDAGYDRDQVITMLAQGIAKGNFPPGLLSPALIAIDFVYANVVLPQEVITTSLYQQCLDAYGIKQL